MHIPTRACDRMSGTLDALREEHQRNQATMVNEQTKCDTSAATFEQVRAKAQTDITEANKKIVVAEKSLCSSRMS